MFDALTVGAAAFPAGIVYSSFAEWTFHRKLLHRPFRGLGHFYRGHAKVHHRRYQSDSTYIVGDRAHKDLTLAWWAMPFPILAHAPILVPLALWVSMPAAIGVLGAFLLYQATYEYLHYCMHVPRDRWFERSAAFKWIDAHHREHHRKHNTNLNVVLPLADFLFNTRKVGRRRSFART